MKIINHKGKYYLKTETGYKKILATTDNLIIGVPQFIKGYLPRPSNDFLNVFVKEYNKGNQITEVLVELDKHVESPCICDTAEKVANCMYQRGIDNCNKKWEDGTFWRETMSLKISKDNTITIKPISAIKTSWNRDEAINLLKFFIQNTRGNWVDADDEWIEQNL